MNKLFVVLLSFMFAFAPVANVISEEVPEKTASEETAPVVTIGAEEAATEDEAQAEEVVKTSAFVLVDDRFGGGDYIKTENKTFNNSLFYAGNTIVDTSKVETGIGFFAGRDLLLSGQYEYGLHAANTIVINSAYERDLFALGNIISITEDAQIGRDAFIAANELKVYANIHGDAMIAANKVIFENVTIDGNLRIAASKVEFRGDVTVKGEYLHNDNIESSGLVVAASTSTYSLPIVEFHIDPIWVMFFQLAAAIVLLLVFIFIARNFSRKIRNEAETANSNEIMLTFFMGVCAAILAPVLAALLMIAVVGIPAGLILLLAWVVLLAVSSVVTAIYVASKFMPNMNTIIGSVLVLILFAIFSMLPYISIAAKVCEVCFGFGLMFKALTVEKK